MKSLLIPVIVILFYSDALAQSDNHSNSGRTAPNFKLENIDREVIELNDLIGSDPILLCFWYSCCKAAVEQLDAFSVIFEKYKAKGLILLGIATDNEKTVAKVKPYIKVKNYQFPMLYDFDGAVARVFYVFDIPFSVLINRAGIVTYSHLGYIRGDEIGLENIIKSMIDPE